MLDSADVSDLNVNDRIALELGRAQLRVIVLEATAEMTNATKDARIAELERQLYATAEQVAPEATPPATAPADGTPAPDGAAPPS